MVTTGAQRAPLCPPAAQRKQAKRACDYNMLYSVRWIDFSTFGPTHLAISEMNRLNLKNIYMIIRPPHLHFNIMLQASEEECEICWEFCPHLCSFIPLMRK